MKIVLLIAGIIVAVVLLVVAIGMLLPKQHVASRSAFFKAPPERIFALIAGPQDWRNDVARFEVLDATHAKTRETWKDGTVIEYLVVKSEPPFVWSGVSLAKTSPSVAGGPSRLNLTAAVHVCGLLKTAKSTIRCSASWPNSSLATRALSRIISGVSARL
jgi:hypothetical protein